MVVGWGGGVMFRNRAGSRLWPHFQRGAQLRPVPLAQKSGRNGTGADRGPLGNPPPPGTPSERAGSRPP